jgi:hypothetical protein
VTFNFIINGNQMFKIACSVSIGMVYLRGKHSPPDDCAMLMAQGERRTIGPQEALVQAAAKSA